MLEHLTALTRTLLDHEIANYSQRYFGKFRSIVLHDKPAFYNENVHEYYILVDCYGGQKGQGNRNR